MYLIYGEKIDGSLFEQILGAAALMSGLEDSGICRSRL